MIVHADIQTGHEKLAEVLKCKVVLKEKQGDYLHC